MDDQQLTAVGGSQNFNTLLNADKTKGFGFEADAAFLATARTMFTAGVSLNDTEIDDPNLGVVPGAAPGLTVLDPAVPGNPGVVSIDGNDLPNAPKWVLNGTFRNGVPVGPRTELFLFTDWAYRSEVSFFLYDSVEFGSQDPWFEGGVRVGYAHIDGDYEIAAFVRNVTDEVAVVGAIDFNNLTGMVNEPRTFGLEMRRNF
jgi:iron complex outermembrane receptor protein